MGKDRADINIFQERRRNMKTWLWVMAILAMVFAFMVPANAADVKRITKEELKPVLASPDLVVVDVRKGSDWDSSDAKIKSALREDPEQVEKWMAKYSKDKTLVFY